MKPKKANHPGILEVIADGLGDCDFEEALTETSSKENNTMKIRRRMRSSTMTYIPLCVVVTCHKPYLKYLPNLLPIIDGQLKSENCIKILALDNCSYNKNPTEWIQVKTNHHGPGLGRNLGLKIGAKSEWFVFWDADNIPEHDFFKKCLNKIKNPDETTGLYYSTTKNTSTGQQISHVPASKDVREGFFTDTASLWRGSAVLQANGWSLDNASLEDWDLANKVQANGWGIQPLNATVLWNKHGENRTFRKSLSEKLWHRRSIGIITLMRGDYDLLDRYLETLNEIKLPDNNVGLTIVDDSNSEPFSFSLYDELAKKVNLSYFNRVTILKGFEPNDEIGNFNTIHSRVGGLYAKAFAATPEQLILTWEDDVFPKNPEALRELSDYMMPNNRIAAVAGMYNSRNNDKAIVACMGKERWKDTILESSIKGEGPMQIGMCGFGFTLWSRSVLEKHPILGQFTLKDGFPLGADGFLCRRINKYGWRILLNTSVKCDHIID
jgi:GT2 family glycosyltransferase